MAGIARILQTFVGFFVLVVVIILWHCVSSACLVLSDVAVNKLHTCPVSDKSFSSSSLHSLFFTFYTWLCSINAHATIYIQEMFKLIFICHFCRAWFQDRSQLRACPRTSQCVADSFSAEIWSHAGTKYRQRFYVSWGESFYSTHFSTFTHTHWKSDMAQVKEMNVLNMHGTRYMKWL